MPDISPYARTSASQTDAAALLARLLTRHSALPALHWSLTTTGDKLIGTSLSEEPSIQRAETRVWATATGVSLTEDQACDTTYLYGHIVLHGVRLVLHTMIIIRPDEDSSQMWAHITGEPWN
jgi:hypothetical protein